MKPISFVHRHLDEGLIVIFRRFPGPQTLRIDTRIIQRHLSRFSTHFLSHSETRFVTQFFRTGDSQLAAWALFQHLHDLSTGNPGSLAEVLLFLWEEERRRQRRPFRFDSTRSNISIASTFEALCHLLQLRNFDCSEPLFRQLGLFLIAYFNDITIDDPRSSARCLVALDSLRHDMAWIIQKLARNRGALGLVIREAAYEMDCLSDLTKRELEELLSLERLRRTDDRRLLRDPWRSRRHALDAELGGRLELVSAYGDRNHLQLNLKGDSPPYLGMRRSRHQRLRDLLGYDYDSDDSEDLIPRHLPYREPRLFLEDEPAGLDGLPYISPKRDILRRGEREFDLPW